MAPDCRLPAKMSLSSYGRTADDQSSKNSSASPLDRATFPAQSPANFDAGVSNEGFDPSFCEQGKDERSRRCVELSTYSRESPETGSIPSPRKLNSPKRENPGVDSSHRLSHQDQNLRCNRAEERRRGESELEHREATKGRSPFRLPLQDLTFS